MIDPTNLVDGHTGTLAEMVAATGRRNAEHWRQQLQEGQDARRAYEEAHPELYPDVRRRQEREVAALEVASQPPPNPATAFLSKLMARSGVPLTEQQLDATRRVAGMTGPESA
jgi:hypothetical protein